jgi:hypothetical protein
MSDLSLRAELFYKTPDIKTPYILTSVPVGKPDTASNTTDRAGEMIRVQIIRTAELSSPAV